MKQLIPMEPQEKRKSGAKLLFVLAAVVAAAFVLLLIVGFENVLALFRYRVTLFLFLGPLIALFLWCAYKAFWPKSKS